MKKLVISAMAVLATAGLAMAVPAFSLPDAPITFNPDLGQMTATVQISVTGLDEIITVTTEYDPETGDPYELTTIGAQGINLYLGASPVGNATGPVTGFVMSNFKFLDPGMTFTGNSSGAMTAISMGAGTGARSITTTTLSGGVTGSLLGTVLITAYGPIGTNGFLTTNLNDMDNAALAGYQSDFAGVAALQDSVQLKIVPEPVSALLLLAGLPLIRRRRA